MIYHLPVADADFSKLDLDAFAVRLIETLKAMHVEQDADDPQFGLIYETYDPVQKVWVEAEGRDTMHHMMWCMVGLANAYRATKNPQARDLLMEFPYAFYLRMMLGGEKYFGKEYGNGFCPYYWDDGDSAELGNYLRNGAATDVRINGHSPISSVHLAQDLAVGHLDLWWLTGDPRLQQATRDLYQQVHFGTIAQRFAARNYALNVLKAHPAKDLARFREAEAQGREMLAGLTDDQRRALYEKQFPPSYAAIVTAATRQLDPSSTLPAVAAPHHKVHDNLAWLRLHNRVAGGIPAFPDDLAFDYYLSLTSASGAEAVNEPFARWFTMWFLTRSLMNEYWMDDAGYRHGYYHFPGVGAAWEMKDGRFKTLHSQTAKHTWHTRGLHFTWMTAIALQMIDKWPEMHEQLRRETAADDPVVRFTDHTPELDGVRDATYAAVFDQGKVNVLLASDPLSLFVLLSGHAGHDASVTIHEADNPGQHFAQVKVAADGAVSVVNAQDQPLRFWSQAGKDGTEIQIPYMINRVQQDWLTAVEHGRYRVELQPGGAGTAESARNVYFLSDAQRIARRLQDTVEGTIVNHARIYNENGWLPYSLADKSRDLFGRLSFSGAYGHLIHSIAQYQIWKQGGRDWELKRSAHLTVK